jgi:hypothetical protein
MGIGVITKLAKVVDKLLVDAGIRSELANHADLSKGTGMVANAVQVINVCDFGADRTGVADSTVAIQAAIDYCTATRMAFINGAIQQTAFATPRRPPKCGLPDFAG